MTEKNTPLYKDGLTVLDFKQQIASFVTEAIAVGVNMPLEHLDDATQLQRTEAVEEIATALGTYFSEYIEMVPEELGQEYLDDAIEGAYRLIDLFSVPGEYDILVGSDEPVSVLHTMMVVMMSASILGVKPVTDFSLGMVADSLFHALDEQDCKDPVFLYHKGLYMEGVEEQETDDEGSNF